MKKIALITLGLLGCYTASMAADLSWDDGYAPDSRIDRSANWDADGLPDLASGNTGTVGTGFTTENWTGYQFTGMNITYTGDSSLTSAGNARPSGGASITFNDTSSFTSSRLYLGYASGGGAFTFNDNSTGTISSHLAFGWTAGTPSSGTLNLGGNALINTDRLELRSPGVALVHHLTLADSSSLIVTGTPFADANQTLIVNFEQADNEFTPSWLIDESRSHDFSYVQYQINGVATTLLDARFVLTEGVGGFDTLQLSTIPEPSTYALFGGLLALGSVMIRRRR